MSNIGNLSFLIGGDDQELKKILEERKKDAVALQKLLSSFSVGNNNATKQVTDSLKIQEKQLRLVEQQNKTEESKERRAGNSLILEQRLNNELEKGIGIRRRNAAAENERVTSEQRVRTEAEKTEAVRRQQLISAAKLASIERERANRDRIDNQRLLTEIQRTEAARRRAQMAGTTGQHNMNSAMQLTNRTMLSQNALLSQLSTQVGIYFSVYQAGRFVKELAMVSGGFEKQRLSLAAILKDKESANKLFGQIKDLAVYSPFNFKELTDYAKQLSAFSIPANELFDTMKRLADVSAGLGVDMRRIILAYGQIRSAAVLRGQEVRQLSEAGLPIIDELGKKFGELEKRAVSAGEVFDKISNREVPFAMVKEIFEELTNEGGKFYEMQRIQATSLAGMISNLQDAYDIMLDSIGTANSDLMKGVVGGLVDVMENWERYWAILKTIIIGYGAYRAGVIASIVANKGLITTVKALTIVQAMQNAVAKVNPYALAFAGIAALIGGIIAYTNYQGQMNEKLLSSVTQINNQAESVNKLLNRLKELTKESKDNQKAEAERASIIKKLLEKEPELAKAIRKHADDLEYLTEVQEKYNKLMEGQKFAKYAIAETGGMFSDSIIENLEKMTKAQNVADMNAVKLDNTYTHLIETWKKLKEAGGMETMLGKVPFAKGREKEIDDILASEKTHAEKVMEVYSKIYHIGQNYKYKTNLKDGDMSDFRLYKELFDSDKKEKVSDYSQSLFELSNYTKQANTDLTDFAKTLEVHFKGKDIDVFDTDKGKQEQIRTFIKSLEELGKHGQKEILAKWNIEFEVKGGIDETLEGWRKEVNDKLNANDTIVMPIMPDTNFNELVDDLKKKYKEIKTTLDEQKPLLIKMGFDFGKELFPSPIAETEVMKQLKESYQRNLKQQSNIANTSKLMGMNLGDLFTPKEKGQKKDKVTAELKRQVELIKSAKKEFDGLRKLMSGEDAHKKIQSIDEYKNVKLADITETGYVDFLRGKVGELNAHIKKTNSETAKDVRVVWNKELGTIQIEKITKDVGIQIEKIEKYLSQHKDKFNLYKQIFEITGDKSEAARIAFGDPMAQIESYIDELKKAFENSSGISFSDFMGLDDENKSRLLVNDQIKKLRDEIESAEKDEKIRKDDIYTSSLIDYLGNYSKRLAITKEYEEKIAIAKEKGNEVLASKLSVALDSELLKLTPNYEKFFTSIYSLTQKEAIEIGRLIKQNLKEQMDKGVISTKDYYEGIRQINRELEKSQKGLKLFESFQSNGIDGLLNSLKEKAENQYQSSSIDFSKALEDYNTALSIGNESSASLAQNNMQAAEGSMQAAEGMQGFASAASGAVSMVDMIVKAIDQSVKAMQQLVDQFAELAESRGIDTDDGKWADIKGAMSVMSAVNEKAKGAWDSAKSGDGMGALANTVGIVTSGLTAINKWHDGKLDKAIRKSQFEVKKLGNAYDEIVKTIDRQLGAVSENQSKEMVQNLEKQRSEIQSQMQNEQDKKKTDNNAVEDYKTQIKELDEQIRYFYEDLAGEQFGIKIKDWAKNIADSLVDAWTRDEDAAKAFDNTVADIMKNVFKSVLQLQYVEPMMNQLRSYLFGSDGRGGILGDGELSGKDMNGLVAQLASLRGNIENWKGAWDTLVEAAKQAGINLEDATSEDTLSKGITGVTEDTANLLASYINAMRADLSMQRVFVERIMLNADINKNTFALMQADIMRIQINTLATANNTSRLVDISEETNTLLRRASTSGSGVRFNIV